MRLQNITLCMHGMATECCGLLTVTPTKCDTTAWMDLYGFVCYATCRHLRPRRVTMAIQHYSILLSVYRRHHHHDHDWLLVVHVDRQYQGVNNGSCDFSDFIRHFLGLPDLQGLFRTCTKFWWEDRYPARRLPDIFSSCQQSHKSVSVWVCLERLRIYLWSLLTPWLE